jgi:hypothetical protein
MNIKKSVFLFLALLLPIVTFLFLKFFGKNEFSVEPLFQTVVQPSEACSDIKYSAPYAIADSLLSEFQRGVEDSITLVVFQNSQVAKQQEQTIQLTRVFKEFVNERMGVVKVVTDSANENRKEARLKILSLEDAEFSRHQKCIFLLVSLNDAVVIDKENRIRGQYVMSNREEADRLIMELKILLKKY